MEHNMFLPLFPYGSPWFLMLLPNGGTMSSWCWAHAHEAPCVTDAGPTWAPCDPTLSSCIGLLVGTYLGLLSCRIGSALAWHSEGGVFAARWLQQVLMPACAPCSWTSGGTALLKLGYNGQSIGSVSDAIARRWLWSTAKGSSPFGYFSSIQQVVDNWPHEKW